jgi:hypothetical protein
LSLVFLTVPFSADAASMAILERQGDGSYVDRSPSHPRGGSGFCTEAEDFNPPACGVAPGNCIVEAPLGICLRPGTLFRLTLCADPISNDHERHPFTWSTDDALPPSLVLVDPFGTSTAYVGGDVTVGASPPSHNGLHFGEVTGPFCGTFAVDNDDDCANDELHGECSTLPVPLVTGVDGEDPVLGQNVVGRVLAEGGTGNYIFSIVGGELPDGVELGSDGVFTGAPTEAGGFTFTVRVAEDPEDPIFVNPEGCALAPACEPAFNDLEFGVFVFAASSTTLLPTTTVAPTTTLVTGTTLPVCPAPSDVCGRPLNPQAARPVASDCLFILQAAVGLEECCLCPCDVDSNDRIVASDALRCLQNAVRLPAALNCAECPAVEL